MSAVVLILSLSALIGVLCRLEGLTWRTHRPAVVGMHVAWGVACCVSAYRAAYGDVSVGDLASSIGVLCWLSMSLPTWRNGPPEHASKPMPLDGRESKVEVR